MQTDAADSCSPPQTARQKIDEALAAYPPPLANAARKLRRLILNADGALMEDWKYNAPAFALCAADKKKPGGAVCGLQLRRRYVSLVFFRGAHIKDAGIVLRYGRDNQNRRSARFCSAAEIDEALISALVRAAVEEKKRRIPIIPPPPPQVPADLAEMLAQTGARAAFDALPATRRRAHIRALTSAKRPQTRARRAFVIAAGALAAGRP